MSSCPCAGRFGNLKSCHILSHYAVKSHHCSTFSLILNFHQIPGILLKPMLQRKPLATLFFRPSGGEVQLPRWLPSCFLQTNLLDSCSTNCSYFFQTHQSFSKWHPDSQPRLLWTPDLLGLSISPCSLPATALGQQQKPSHQPAPWREGSLHAKLQSRTKPWVWKPI